MKGFCLVEKHFICGHSFTLFACVFVAFYFLPKTGNLPFLVFS